MTKTMEIETCAWCEPRGWKPPTPPVRLPLYHCDDCPDRPGAEIRIRFV